VYPSHRNQTKTDTSSSRWQVVCSPCEALSLVTVCVETILVFVIFVRFLFYSILYLHVDLWYVCTSTVLGWCVYVCVKCICIYLSLCMCVCVCFVHPSYRNKKKTDTSSSRWQVVCSPCEALSIVTVCVETILVLLIFVPFLFYSILYLHVDLWYVCTSTVLGVYVCMCVSNEYKHIYICVCVCACALINACGIYTYIYISNKWWMCVRVYWIRIYMFIYF